MTTINQQAYWYLASYPKSGNTWCRVFITELQRLAALQELERFNLNHDLQTGTIASSRHWLDDQLGINCCDLSFAELDPIRGRAGESALLYSEGERFHKVHDAFVSPDSKGRSVVNTQGCQGAVYILRHPEDVVVSLSHFFSWELERCVESLVDSQAALVRSERHGGNQVRQHMGRWDQHVHSWLDQKQIPVLAIRYEDMLANGVKTFTALAQFLGLPDEASLIKTAISNTSIDRLKKMEDEVGGFVEKPKGCERFFRSGRTGEGAEQLTLVQRKKLASQLKSGMVRFGYEGPECASAGSD
jgi:aryl sulfotransferase